MKTFNPLNSVVNEDQFTAWMNREVTSNLEDVPGIGPKSKEKLKEIGITTTHQLFAMFLSMKSDNITTIQHGDAFYQWLCDSNIQSVRRAGVVRCIGSKLDLFFPGLYDDTDFDESNRLPPIVEIDGIDEIDEIDVLEPTIVWNKKRWIVIAPLKKRWIVIVPLLVVTIYYLYLLKWRVIATLLVVIFFYKQWKY